LAFASTAVAVLVLGASAQAVPPANDNLASAVSLGNAATGSTTGTDLDATFETNESSALTSFGTTGDVWFTWTAPSSGFVAFRTTDPGTNPNLDTVLAAHTGTDITALSTVAVNDDYPSCCMSRIIFNAASGTLYDIGVGAFPADPASTTQGPFGLEWGGSNLYDQDTPFVTAQPPTRLKHAFSLSFSVSDGTASIVGSSWITTECKVDSGSFGSCTSPWLRSGLTGGLHTWTIRATDGAGNIGLRTGTVRVKGSPKKTS
jgi:hypothetical protein